MRNRLHNSTNPYQGDFKKVLCVCSAGLLRSPTAALVLSQAPFNHNTRACGLDLDHALIPIDDVLIHWADEIVCMTESQEAILLKKLAIDAIDGKKVVCLNIPDSFAYRDPELVTLIRDKCTEIGL